jgi:hypothetical protein
MPSAHAWVNAIEDEWIDAPEMLNDVADFDCEIESETDWANAVCRHADAHLANRVNRASPVDHCVDYHANHDHADDPHEGGLRAGDLHEDDYLATANWIS